jgi:hypothetical protein
MKRAADDVAAVFEHRAAADLAVAELCDRGLAHAHLRESPPWARRLLELDTDAEVFRSMRWGIAIALPLGIIVSSAIAWIGSGSSIVDAIAAGTLAGVLLGLFFGGVGGVLWSMWVVEDEDEWNDYVLDGDEVLVVARAHGRPEEIRAVMTRHGGRLTEHAEPRPLVRVGAGV